jgi:hypothetical protein
MRVLILALAACYSPQLAPCAVTCGSDSPCPEDFAGGSDSYCHTGDDSTVCAITLNVTMIGGDGHVTSTPDGIDCSSNDPQPCKGQFPPGTHVTLSAHNNFSRWNGDACDGSSNPSCTFTLTTTMTISASFH